jgi:membrane-bound lytic murein transglycosylase D
MKLYKFFIFIILFNTYSSADITDDFPSYAYVLNEFDVDTNFIYDRDFQNFVYKNREAYTKRFIDAVNRGMLIVPTMKEVMYQKDISPLFIYLAMTESSFKTEAKSVSAAGGLWQFIRGTGKEQKLQINSTIDERYDPIKSTFAAVDYLYKIRQGLGRWYLAAMAYNCGQGCMQRAIDRVGTRDLATLLHNPRAKVPAQTKKYIKKILLFALIGENYLFKENDTLGEMIHQINPDTLIPVTVRAGEDLHRIASVLNMDYGILKRTNMHLRSDYVPRNSNVKVNIPTSRLDMFNTKYAQLNPVELSHRKQKVIAQYR